MGMGQWMGVREQDQCARPLNCCDGRYSRAGVRYSTCGCDSTHSRTGMNACLVCP